MKIISIGLIVLLGCLSCKSSEKKVDNGMLPSIIQAVMHGNPDWDDHAVMYEVNIRQFTKEGTFNALIDHIDRLDQMGVDILWLMPIFPISPEKRKGSLGSYYSVSDFMETNPEFGTKQDFKKLVEKVHANGMKIIIDWVPNHTGWGHVWLKTHPEYYTQDSLGNIIDPIDPGTGKSWGWTDVADLNYDNKSMRQAHIDALQYWVSDFDVDGYRFDVAHNVPADFLKSVSDTLRAMKSVLLLGESEVAQYRNEGSLDVDYGWELHHVVNDIAKGKKHASAIDTFLSKDRIKNQKGYHIYFTSNHDENSWQGTEFERMGAAHKALAVFSFTFDGMPLIYNGQEEPLKRRLKFFDKDSIQWKTFSYAPFYKTLFDLKETNKALGNGSSGVPLEKIATHPDVYAFTKSNEGQSVVVILNLSNKKQQVTFSKDISSMKEIFTNVEESFKAGQKLSLNPWEYRVYSN